MPLFLDSFVFRIWDIRLFSCIYSEFLQAPMYADQHLGQMFQAAHTPSNFLKAVFHKFYLVHSSILFIIRYCLQKSRTLYKVSPISACRASRAYSNHPIFQRLKLRLPSLLQPEAYLLRNIIL